MPYLNAVIDWIESEEFVFECGEDVNTAFQDIEDEWQPNNGITIPELLKTSMPDLMLYLQKQIDNECEDETEIITFGEDNLDELKRYIESEIILEPAQSVDEQFEDISRILKGDNRSAMDKILRRNKEELLDFLRSRLSELSDEPKTDEEAGALERAVEPLERSLEGVLQGATNLLETPIRLIDELVLPIIREPVRIIEEEVKKTGIIESVKGFFRSLFS